MEIKVGEYVRTKQGDIDRIYEYKEDTKVYICEKDLIIDTENMIGLHIQDVVKHSPNIIDVIEVGDYVNGQYVKECKNGYIMVGNGLDGFQLWERNIKTILTKEQYLSMEYRLED